MHIGYLVKPKHNHFYKDLLYGAFEAVETFTNIKELYFEDEKLSFNVRLKQLPRNMPYALL